MLPPSQFWLDGWSICLNFAVNFADDFVVDDPRACFFLKGLLLQIYSGLELILGYLVLPSLVWLDFLESISPSLVSSNFSEIVRILYSCVLARFKFAVIVDFFHRLGSKLPCLFPFYFIILWIPCILFSRGSCAVSFFVLFVLFRFVGNWLLFQGP